MKKKTATTIAIIFATVFTVLFCVWAGIRIYSEVTFNNNCKQYIKRAADASTIEVAREELGKAIEYAEKNNLTEGIVHIFFKQPKNDIGFWYNNMVSAYNELCEVDENTNSMEQTNLLMKLRESLVDNTEDGVSVTVPSGIAVYPNNALLFWFGIISAIMMIGLWLFVFFSDAVFYY